MENIIDHYNTKNSNVMPRKVFIMLFLKRYFNVIRAGRMIPIVMGASKEAYSLFGPEVKFSDSGKIILPRCDVGG